MLLIWGMCVYAQRHEVYVKNCTFSVKTNVLKKCVVVLIRKIILPLISVFKISAGPRTLTGKICVGPASFPSLSYINFAKIVLRSGKF